MVEYKKLFRNKNFRYLLISQFLSQLTIQLMNFLLLIKVTNETNSPFASSLLWIVYSLPSVCVGPIAAVSVDILEKRKILVYTNFFQSLTLLVYSLIFNTSIFIMYAIVFIYSFLNQFYVPSESVVLTLIIDKKDYTQGNSVFFFTQQASIMLGFLLAGPLHIFVGIKYSLYLGALMLFIAFLAVRRLPKLSTNRSNIDFEYNISDFFIKIKEGYDYIKNSNMVKIPFLLMLSCQVCLTIIVINIPFISKALLDLQPEKGGLFIILPAIIGASLSSLLLPKLINKFKDKFDLVRLSLYVLSGSLFFSSIMLPEITNLVFKLISLMINYVLLGMSFSILFTVVQTVFQQNIPEYLRGRVFGNYWFVLALITFIPVILSGFVTEIFGVKTLIILLSFMGISASVFLRNVKYSDYG